MTRSATPTPSKIPTKPTKALQLSLAAIAVVSLSACQTVDLGDSSESIKDAVVQPACAVSPGDYKVLAYLQKAAADKKARITEVLKKKYASAGVDANPIIAAQAFVTSNADKSPAELEALVENACKN